MSTNANKTTITNINPLTVEVPADLMATFDQVTDDSHRLALSTTALRLAAEKAGIDLPHFAKPNKDSSPEHRFSYAMLQRLAVGKLAALLGVTPDTFEPIYNSATGGGVSVTIGEETRTKQAWQQRISNVLRPVKENWEKSIRSEVDAAKTAARFAKAALDKAEKDAEKTAADLEAAEKALAEIAEKVDAQAAAVAVAKGKERAKLAAYLEAAKQEHAAQMDLVTMVEDLDREALLNAAEHREALAECEQDVAEKQAMLPKARGAKARKSDAEAAIGKVDALIATLSKSDGTGYGSADLAEAVYHLKLARTALSN